MLIVTIRKANADDQLALELVVGLRVAAQRLLQLLDSIQEDGHA